MGNWKRKLIVTIPMMTMMIMTDNIECNDNDDDNNNNNSNNNNNNNKK